MLNHDNICMRLIHCVVIREKPPSKRPRKQSRKVCPLTNIFFYIFLHDTWANLPFKRKLYVHECEFYLVDNAI